MSRVCLNMIVKNEAPILERALLSAVRAGIDAYVIGDTGSTDGTPDLIAEFFDKYNIPGEVHHFPFEDYSQARNLAFQFAQKSPLDFDTVLFMDADMELVVHEPDWKEKILFPVLSVRQINDLNYFNTRLVHRKIPGTYMEPTHEYFASPFASQNFEAISFLDHADGTNRSEKSERDLRLLLQSLETNPNNARSHFYLAQTYMDLGQWQKAIDHYQTRRALGGWSEEEWYSLYKMAQAYEHLNDEARFVHTALEAFEERSGRAEPLLLLAKHYRVRGKNDLAVQLALWGKKIPFPEQDLLFIESEVYGHAFDHEIAISGFYTPEKQEGYEACMHLSACAQAPEDIRSLARNNARFYAKSAKELFPSFETFRIPEMAEEGYVSLNPSIARNPIDGSLACIVRTVNYTINSTGHYLMGPDGVIRTKNLFFGKIDPTRLTEPKGWSERTFILDGQNRPKTNFPVQGYEDCRLFHWDRRWWASATVRDRNEEGICEIVLFQVHHAETEKLLSTHEQHHKNWMPFIFPKISISHQEPDLGFVVQVDPLTLHRYFAYPLLAGKETIENAGKAADFALPQLRGGSQLIPWRDGYLAVLHESYREGKSQYLHRFVHFRIDLDTFELEVNQVSHLFYFHHQGIEFCAGLAQENENHLLISYGVNDREGWIGRIKIDDVNASFHEF